jgi:hypothetical protein
MEPKKNYLMNFGAVGRSIFYRIACDCTDPDCDMTLELENNPTDHIFYLHMTKKLRNSAYWGCKYNWGWFDWVEPLVSKIRMCWQIIVHGYIEVMESLVIKDEERIKELQNVLDEGIIFLRRTKSDTEEE